MLTFYPDLVDHVVKLVFSEKVAEAQMLEDLEFLCKSGTHLVNGIVLGLAEKVAERGMELLW